MRAEPVLTRRPQGPMPTPRPSSAYLRDLPQNALLSMPLATLRDAAEDVRLAWGQAAARTMEALHNNGWIAGAVEKSTAAMIGDGLRPNLKPDFRWAGWDDRQTADWGRLAQERFQTWARNPYECDAGGRYTLAQIQAASVRAWYGTGEALAQFPTVWRPGGSWGTKVRLLPPTWLSQKSYSPERIEHGIILDANRATVGFVFNVREFSGAIVERRVAARDGFGRPMIVHVFDGAAGQIRGITPFAPILKVLRNYDQLSDATLTAAMIHAIFAATVESEYPTSDVLDALRTADEAEGMSSPEAEELSRFDEFMGQKVGWHKHVDINLGNHGKIAHLMTGEKLHLQGSEHPNSTYEPFANFLLREIASCSGNSFEDLTGDYRGATYSSVRMSIAKLWPVTLYRRNHVPGPISQAALEAFLEEEVDSGALVIPGGINAFVANKAAVCRAEWHGPPKPQADDQKAAKAHQTYRDMGVMTDEAIAADLGTDIEDVYRQRAFEKARREELEIHGGITNGGTDIDTMEEEDGKSALSTAG